jgi:hypothetical protein
LGLIGDDSFDVANCDLKRAGGYGAMIGQGVRTAIVALTLIGGGQVAHGQPEVCSDWQVRKLDKAPEWYEAVLAAPPVGKVTNIGDSLVRTDYVLNDSVTLVQYQHEQFEALNDAGWDDYFEPGAIYLYGTDTVLLDSCAYGYSELSFDGDKRLCVATETEFIGPDGGRCAVVQYDLLERSKTVLRSHVRSQPPQYGPIISMIAYSDFADLYITSPSDAGELVFNGGGGYAQDGECRGRWVTDLRWSPDGWTCVFKYHPDEGAMNQYELFEAHLLGPVEATERELRK